MKRLIIAALMTTTAAHAQQAGCLNGSTCTQTNVFAPSGAAVLSASNVSSSIAFPASGSSLNVMITNQGSAVAYLAMGNSSIVATTTGIPIQPGQTLAFAQGLNTYIAAITASGTVPLLVQSGVGTPVITYGQQQTQIQTKITSLTVVPLDVGTVATGGTAVTALAAGHATAGGFVGTSNAAGICVDQYQTAGTVTGTPSTTWCVYPGQPYALVPSTHAVSVNSTASGVSIVGEGLQ